MSEPDELPLLLHSPTAVAKQITAALEIVQPGAIVEIGSETGGMTELLVEWAREHEATLICVDPEPAPHVRRLEVEGAPVHVASEFSPESLAGIDGEAWIIDGDHNHATVTAGCATCSGARARRAWPSCTTSRGHGRGAISTTRRSASPQRTAGP